MENYIDSIAFTQNNETINYLIRDNDSRNLINTPIVEISNIEISSICKGLGSDQKGPYNNAYDAINAVIPRWKVCN